MKTLRIISATILAVVMGFSFTSCSSSEAPSASSSTEKVQNATVTYTYEIPAELLDYVMIDAVYNDYQANDVIQEPVLGTKYTMTYRIDQFPTKTPLVFQYRRTNTPMGSVVGQVRMTATVKMNIGGREVVTTSTSSVSASDINALMTNVHNRTYATKISKNGDIVWVNPENY